MHVWTVSEPKVIDFKHRIESTRGHALMVPILTWTFERLGLSASLFDGRIWWPIHSAASLMPFELEYGVETERWSYNEKNIALVQRTKRSVLGEHAGQKDLFVPVILEGDVTGVLVVGPFATARPKSIDVLDRWHSWTGRQAHPRDPSFMAFVRAILSVLVLEGNRPRALQRLVECLADLLGSSGQADALANEGYALRLTLEPARAVDRVWDAARMMVDERSSQAYYSAARAFEMRQLGLKRAPDHVLVGLAAPPGTVADPVDALFTRDALQRSAAQLAMETGDAIAGRVGDHGVVILSAVKGSAADKKKKLLALGAKTASLAKKKYGLTLHLGASLGSGSPLYRMYQEALGAAEAALSSGRKLIVFSKSTPRPAHRLHGLRDELESSVEADPASLTAKFDRYVEALAAHVNHRMEPAHADLALLLERLGESLLRSGALDARSVSKMCEGLDHAATESSTLEELFSAYRRAVADLAAAARQPVAARRDRGLRGALEYVHQHYAEPLPLAKIARVAGFAPKYFSGLFRKREKITFERYVLRLRVERAKHLLTGTDLNITRVAELSGLGTPQYLCRVFRRLVGPTPLEFRASRRPEWTEEAPA